MNFLIFILVDGNDNYYQMIAVEPQNHHWPENAAERSNKWLPVNHNKLRENLPLSALKPAFIPLFTGESTNTKY